MMPTYECACNALRAKAVKRANAYVECKDAPAVRNSDALAPSKRATKTPAQASTRSAPRVGTMEQAAATTIVSR